MKSVPKGTTHAQPSAALTAKVVFVPKPASRTTTYHFRRPSAMKIDVTNVRFWNHVRLWRTCGDHQVWKLQSGKEWIGDEYANQPTTYLLVHIIREPSEKNSLGLAVLLERQTPGADWRQCHEHLKEVCDRLGTA